MYGTTSKKFPIRSACLCTDVVLPVANCEPEAAATLEKLRLGYRLARLGQDPIGMLEPTRHVSGLGHAGPKLVPNHSAAFLSQILPMLSGVSKNPLHFRV